VYPLQLATIKNALSLYVPDQALVRTTYQKLVDTDPTVLFPYWAKIWASSEAMVQFLQEQPIWIQDKIVLEIGAGIGIPSFSIAAQTHKVIISDYAPDAVMLIQKNIEHLNVTNAQAMYLDWNNVPVDIIADTILLSDTNYDPSAHNNLILFIEKLIHNNSIIIVATPNRIASNAFIERISKFVTSSKIYRINEKDGTTEIAVLVLKNNLL
jgi:predicted nicotinamide N-methyase